MQETQLDCIRWWLLFVQVMSRYWGGTEHRTSICESDIRESETPLDFWLPKRMSWFDWVIYQ